MITLDCLVAGRDLSQDFVIASIVEPILIGLDFIVSHHASWNWHTRSIDFQDWGRAGISCHLLEEVNFTQGTITCCRLTVGGSACDGQLLHVDPYMLERGIEL